MPAPAAESSNGSQCFIALEALRHISKESDYPLHLTVRIFEKLDRELDGDLPTVLVERWHRKQLAIVVGGDAGPYCGCPPRPVSGTKTLRDNEVHGSANYLGFGEAEDSFGSPVPGTHHTHAVANQDRIWRAVQNPSSDILRQSRHRNSHPSQPVTGDTRIVGVIVREPSIHSPCPGELLHSLNRC